MSDDRPNDPSNDGEADLGPVPNDADDARPLLRVALLAGLMTAVAAGASRGLRRIGDPTPAAVDAIATVLAVASVLLLITTIGSAVLWVFVRFVDRR